MDDQPPNAPAAPIPFYPALRKHFRLIYSCLLFTYIEINYPPDPADPWGIVRVSRWDLARAMAADIDSRYSRNNLFRCFTYMATLYYREEERLRARMAGREFLRDKFNRAPQAAVYSAVTDLRDTKSSIWLCRNLALIAQIQADVGFFTHPLDTGKADVAFRSAARISTDAVKKLLDSCQS